MTKSNELEMTGNETIVEVEHKPGMLYFFSPSENGFFVERERLEGIPDDSVEITEELYLSLINNQDGSTRIIIGEDGLPCRSALFAPTEELIKAKKSEVDFYMAGLMRAPVTIDGVTIRPESDEQTSLTSMLTGAQFTGQTSFDFKFQDTWVTLTEEQLRKIVKALHVYVQAMYSALRAHHEALDKFKDLPQDKATPVVNYDYKQNWPVFEDFI